MSENGRIQHITHNHKNQALKTDLEDKFIKKIFCNYLSIGADARIGLGFDKKRTNSRLCNKIVYMCEGLKKTFLKTSRLKEVVTDL